VCGAPAAAAAQQFYLLNEKYKCFNALLGVGQTGVVRPGTDLSTGAPVAIKILDRAYTECDAVRREAMRREICVSLRLRHENIIQLKDVVVDRSKIHLCLELAQGGELFSQVQKRGRLPEEESRVLFAQIVRALDYCHSQSVCHRDLKLENILLKDVGSTTIKVTDFGFSKDWLNDSLPKTKRVGTLAYMAPEVALLEGSSSRGGQAVPRPYDGNMADLWACGVILFILVSGQYPFGDQVQEKTPVVYRRIAEGDYTMPHGVTPECADLISRLLVTDPTKRASLDEVKGHPWYDDMPHACNSVRRCVG
jgi:serine/threonine-protein kinase SRK2